MDSEEKQRLVNCPPILELTPDARAAVLDAVVLATAAPGEVIFNQGDRGDFFHVVLSGEVEVVWGKDGAADIQLVELGAGAYFGEQALLGPSPSRRLATVRACGTCRHAAIPAAVFQEHVVPVPRNVEAFEQDAANYLYERVAHSLESDLYAKLDDPDEEGDRRCFAPGEVIVNEGAPSDAVFLILTGVTLVLQRRGQSHHEISHLGGGQIFGELGVLQGRPRTATVVAKTPVEVLRVEGPAFIEWRASNPGFAPFFQSLAQLYTLSEGRELNLFLGEVNGEKAISTVQTRPTTGVVSTRILDRGVVVFANNGVRARLPEWFGEASGKSVEHENLSFNREDFRRELRVIVLERREQHIQRCVIHALVAEGIGPDLGSLYRRVVDLEEVSARELQRFRRTGHLGAEAPGPDRLCACLGLGQDEITRVGDELANDYNAVRKAVGCGLICGGCEPVIRRFLQGRAAVSTREPGEGASPSTGSPVEVSDRASFEPEVLPSDLDRMARLLKNWSPDGSGTVTREEVSLYLRGLGVRDLDKLLDTLFPGSLPPGLRVPVHCLVSSLAQAMQHTRALKQELRPAGPGELFFRYGLRVLLKYRLPAFWTGVTGVAAAAFGLLLATASANAVLFGLTVLGLAGTAVVLLKSPAFRFAVLLLHRGPQRIYSAMFAAFGKTSRYEQYRPLGPWGPPVFYLRDEAMIERVLHTPEIYVKDPRVPLERYSIFGVHSILWGGTDPFWLGTRSVCEEYFLDGYQDDLSDIGEIVQERVHTWKQRGEIDLLDEIYRIILEIRARVFFQTTFHCFENDPEVDFADLIDRVLMGDFVFLGDENDEVQYLHRKIMTAVEGATRPGSVGARLREAMEEGGYSRDEALHNAVTYVVAQAPTMGIFWTLYRAAKEGNTSLRGDRRAIARALKEEMRLHPPVTSLFLRQATCEDTLGDARVPQGAWIFVCPLFIHTNPELWTQPESYQPDRWSVPTGDATEIVEPRTDPTDSGGRSGALAEDQVSQRYLPFGSGPHSCQGRWFATDEMLLVIQTVLELVELEVVEDHGLLDRPLVEQLMLHVYNRPVHDVRLKVVLRPSTDSG